MAEGYDFIIIGGGSAGCVLAARLTEDPAARVLLLEAGGRDRHPFYHLPAGFAKMTKGIGSWGWQTVPQRHMNGMLIRYTQAKVIGGGSSINAQIYTRGNALDYDEWRQMGCAGWCYEDVLPYFRKAEDNDTYDNRYHGKGGPLGVSQAPRAAADLRGLFRRRRRDRHPAQPRHDRRDAGRRRLLPADPALRPPVLRPRWPILNPPGARPNLTVRTGAQVLRIVVEKGRAVGVETHATAVASRQRRGDPLLRRHRLAAPAACSRASARPTIWPRLGIPVVLDQPEVGANLQDHLDLFVIAECTGPHTYDRYAKPHWSALAGLQYLLTRKGPVASSPLRDRRLLVCRPRRPLARHPVPPRPRLRDRGRRCRHAARRRHAELRLSCARGRGARCGLPAPTRKRRR